MTIVMLVLIFLELCLVGVIELIPHAKELVDD